MKKKKRIDQYEWQYKKLTAQISVYSGKGGGTLSDLQDFVRKLEWKEAVVCEFCGNILFGESRTGHEEDCKLIDNYWKYFR